MTVVPPPLYDPRKVDMDHLRLLSIFYFVGAGLAFIGIGFLGLHYFFMHMVFAHPGTWQNAKNPGPDPEQFFAIFRWFYVIFGLFLTVSIVLNLLAGVFLRQRKHRTFTIVVGALNCLHLPLGTLLGVFTFVVLLRDSVRELYEASA